MRLWNSANQARQSRIWLAEFRSVFRNPKLIRVCMIRALYTHKTIVRRTIPTLSSSFPYKIHDRRFREREKSGANSTRHRIYATTDCDYGNRKKFGKSGESVYTAPRVARLFQESRAQKNVNNLNSGLFPNFVFNFSLQNIIIGK